MSRSLLVSALLALGVWWVPSLAEAQQVNFSPFNCIGGVDVSADHLWGDPIGNYNLQDAQGRVSLEIASPPLAPGEAPPVAQVRCPVSLTPQNDWFYYEVVLEVSDASSSTAIECVAKFHDHVSQRVVTRTASSGVSHTGGSTLTLSIFDYQFRTKMVSEDELNLTLQCTMHPGDKLYSYRVTRL